MKKPELMSPIRDLAGLEACKDYANAVYFGIDELSLRARTKGVKLKDLKYFVSKIHYYKLKAYLTVNAAVYDKDFKLAEKIIKEAKKAKIDALIVWDLAVIDLAKKAKIPFIVSTQANVCNVKAVLFYKKLGAKRIVLARELNLKQIKEIRKKVKGIELEVFVHGAMCLSISGRCILSSYLFGNSANCGYCSQPCRKKWILSDEEGNQLVTQGKYFLSPKDLCMIEYVPALIKAGINAFKIEGRMRDLKYIEVASRCYREAIDAYFNKSSKKDWKKELASVYNRGFSTGFYFGIPGKQGISYDKADNLSSNRKIYIGDIIHYYPKIKVAVLKLSHRGIKKGEKVVIEGKNTFLEQEIKSIEIKRKEVNKASKGIEVGIRVDNRVRPKDKVFIFKA